MTAMYRIKALPLVALVLVLTVLAPADAELGPSTYRTKELSAADRATHGDEVLHGFVDGWFAGRPLHHWAEAHPDTLAEHGHEAVHAWIVTYWERQWVEAYERNAAAEAARIEAERAAQAASRNTVWDRLAQCESGGNWSINTGNGYYGGVQFSAATWRAAGGTKYAAYAHQATREQQIAVAESWLARTSWSQWPACSRKLGLR